MQRALIFCYFCLSLSVCFENAFIQRKLAEEPFFLEGVACALQSHQWHSASNLPQNICIKKKKDKDFEKHK